MGTASCLQGGRFIPPVIVKAAGLNDPPRSAGNARAGAGAGPGILTPGDMSPAPTVLAP